MQRLIMSLVRIEQSSSILHLALKMHHDYWCAGLIPADGDVWKARRRAIVPSLHRKYIENMVRMFGDSALHGVSSLQQAHQV